MFSIFITKRETEREGKCSLAQRLDAPNPFIQSDKSLSDGPPLAEGFERTAGDELHSGHKKRKKKKELQKEKY